MTLISRVPPNGGRLNMLMMGQLLLKVNRQKNTFSKKKKKRKKKKIKQIKQHNAPQEKKC